MKILKNYINGRFVDEDHYFVKHNPSTAEGLCSFPQTSQAGVDKVCKKARESFLKWKKESRLYRAEFFYRISRALENRKEEIAQVISLETGKNYNESIAEVNEALHMAQYAFGSGRTPIGEMVASEIAEKDAYMLRKPKGVVAIISPFNFPLAIGGFWCAAPALVEGNTVILKPSEDAPWTSELISQIYDNAGVPPGVFNVIHGNGEVGKMLSENDVDHICFTGSADVGQKIRRVAAESWNKTTSCELGSKSAVIVFEDANLELALKACVASSLKLSGQRCVSAGRIIVSRKIIKDFSERFVNLIKECKTGAPLIKKTHSTGSPENVCWEEMVENKEMYYGPLINKEALNKVIQYNEMVLGDSEAQVLLRGHVIGDVGNFITPMVYVTEWRNVPYLKNEVFGPHIAIIPFDTLEDAVRIYNDTDYGLAVGVCTEDFKKARFCRDNCDFGMCYWNGGSIAAESHLAFGGVKKSGNGFPSAARTFRAVTHEVSWTVNHADALIFPQGMR